MRNIFSNGSTKSDNRIDAARTFHSYGVLRALENAAAINIALLAELMSGNQPLVPFAARVPITNTIKLLDAVALTVDLPEYNSRRGQVGTAIEILAHHIIRVNHTCGPMLRRSAM